MENFCGLCSEHLSRCKCSERALKEQVVSLCSRVKELEAENARLEKEVDDQCRVNGMGQQREMSLMTELRAKTAECVDIDSKLAAAQNAFRETNRECEALRGALALCVKEIQELSEGEDCEHEISICWCSTWRALREADNILRLKIWIQNNNHFQPRPEYLL